MRPFPRRRVALPDILPLKEYDKRHDEWRRRVVTLKAGRSLRLGPILRIVFENFDTVLFHIHEVLRVRRLSDPEKLLTEIDLYNELQPRPGELSATVFLEGKPDPWAPLLGIEKALSVRVQNVVLARSERIETFLPEDAEVPGRTSPVYFVRFPFREVPLRRFLAEESITLTSDHAAYFHSADMPTALLAELREDLA